MRRDTDETDMRIPAEAEPDRGKARVRCCTPEVVCCPAGGIQRRADLSPGGSRNCRVLAFVQVAYDRVVFLSRRKERCRQYWIGCYRHMSSSTPKTPPKRGASHFSVDVLGFGRFGPRRLTRKQVSYGLRHHIKGSERMMTEPNAFERKALQAAWLGGDWEDRAKLGGEKTFSSLIDKGWIEPYSGHNPQGDRYSITDKGMQAMRMPKTPKPNQGPKLRTLPPRIGPLKGPLDK